MKNANGQYSEKTIMRCGKIVGTIAKSLDAAFHDSVCNTDEDESYRKKHDYHQDIRTFVSEYKDDELFTYIPGRKLVSFPNIQSTASISNKEKFKARLINYSLKLSLQQQ